MCRWACFPDDVTASRGGWGDAPKHCPLGSVRPAPRMTDAAPSAASESNAYQDGMFGCVALLDEYRVCSISCESVCLEIVESVFATPTTIAHEISDRQRRNSSCRSDSRDTQQRASGLLSRSLASRRISTQNCSPGLPKVEKTQGLIRTGLYLSLTRCSSAVM
eukprot:gene15851-biopygen2196